MLGFPVICQPSVKSIGYVNDGAGEMMKLKTVTTHAESVNILGCCGGGGVEKAIHCSTLKDTEHIQLHSPVSCTFKFRHEKKELWHFVVSPKCILGASHLD